MVMERILGLGESFAHLLSGVVPVSGVGLQRGGDGGGVFQTCGAAEINVLAERHGRKWPCRQGDGQQGEPGMIERSRLAWLPALSGPRTPILGQCFEESAAADWIFGQPGA